jgi:hypothetical protein
LDLLDDLNNNNIVDSVLPFYEDYLSNEVLHTYRHTGTLESSRIDYHWLSTSLLPNLLHLSVYWPEHRVVNSDHTIVHSVLLTENLFDMKSAAKLKQQDQGRKVIDYAVVTDLHWNKFKQAIDAAIRDEFTDYKDLSLNDPSSLSTLWTHVSNIIMKFAASILSHKKVYLINSALYRNIFRYYQTNFTLSTNVLE